MSFLNQFSHYKINKPEEKEKEWRTIKAYKGMSKDMVCRDMQYEVGSVSRKDRNITITDREWEAIQAGAISENNLNKILNNADISVLRQKATPKATVELSQAKIDRIKAMSSSYTLSQIADKLGISSSTVSKYLKGK